MQTSYRTLSLIFLIIGFKNLKAAPFQTEQYYQFRINQEVIFNEYHFQRFINKSDRSEKLFDIFYYHSRNCYLRKITPPNQISEKIFKLKVGLLAFSRVNVDPEAYTVWFEGVEVRCRREKESFFLRTNFSEELNQLLSNLRIEVSLFNP